MVAAHATLSPSWQVTRPAREEPSARDDRRRARAQARRLPASLHGRRQQRGLPLIEESGLTITQMKVLLELERPRRATTRTVTELAEELGISPASASRAVDALVRKKLATRVEDADDRRVRRVAITARGQELVDRIVAVRQAGLEAFADPPHRRPATQARRRRRLADGPRRHRRDLPHLRRKVGR